MMTDAIKIFKGSEHYSELLDSFSCGATLERGDNKNISEAIYFHICQMKYAGWRHRVNFNRGRKHSFSDFFQDIIAFYLKTSLPQGYEVKSERKEGKTQPDIAIKRGGKYIFLIEAKTNVGWARPDPKTERGREAIKKMEERVLKLSKNFNISKKNIIYILEEHTNAGKEFSDKFWGETRKRPPRPTDSPFSIMYPLFLATDPYYWEWKREVDKADPLYWEWEDRVNENKHYKTILDEQIQDRAKQSIVTPFEEILQMIFES